jgi:nuclear pore complex protein Nup107
MLPAELASISEPENCATEYLHYQQFFNIWEILAHFVKCQALEVHPMNKDTRAAWLVFVQNLWQALLFGELMVYYSPITEPCR